MKPPGGFALLFAGARLFREVGAWWFIARMSVVVAVSILLALLVMAMLGGVAMLVAIPITIYSGATDFGLQRNAEIVLGFALFFAALLLLAQTSLCTQAVAHYRLDTDGRADQAGPSHGSTIGVALRLALASWWSQVRVVFPLWLLFLGWFIFLEIFAIGDPTPSYIAAALILVCVPALRIRQTFWTARPLGMLPPKASRWRWPRVPWRLWPRLLLIDVAMLIAYAVIIAAIVVPFHLLWVPDPQAAEAFIPLGIAFAAVVLIVFVVWRGLVAVALHRHPGANPDRGQPLAMPVSPESTHAEAARHSPVLTAAKRCRPAKWALLRQGAILLAANAAVFAAYYGLVVAPSYPTEEELDAARKALPHEFLPEPTPAERDYQEFREHLDKLTSAERAFFNMKINRNLQIGRKWPNDDAVTELKAILDRHPKFVEAWNRVSAHSLDTMERNVASEPWTNLFASPSDLIVLLGLSAAYWRDDPDELIVLLEHAWRHSLIQIRYGHTFTHFIAAQYVNEFIIPTYVYIIEQFSDSLTKLQLATLDAMLQIVEKRYVPYEKIALYNSADRVLRNQLVMNRDWIELPYKTIYPLILSASDRRFLDLAPRLLEQARLENWELAKRIRDFPNIHSDQLLLPQGPYDIGSTSLDVEVVTDPLDDYALHSRRLRTLIGLLRLSCWIEAERLRSGGIWGPAKWERWRDDSPLPGPLPDWIDDWSADGEPYVFERFEPMVEWRGDGEYAFTIDDATIRRLQDATVSVDWNDVPLADALAALSEDLSADLELRLHPSRSNAERYRVTLTLTDASAVQVVDMIGQQLGLYTTNNQLHTHRPQRRTTMTPFSGGYRLRINDDADAFLADQLRSNPTQLKRRDLSDR